MISQILVGLGNPGPKYSLTRHNIGFMSLDHLANSLGLPGWSKKFQAECLEHKPTETLFLKPQTFMNLSGQSVQEASQFYKIPSQKIFVIHDEIDQPFGALKIHSNRGAAGHNGIKSMVQCLATQDFGRFRAGVGRPAHPDHAVSDYVLQNFSAEELKRIPNLLERIDEALLMTLEKGLVSAANRFNAIPSLIAVD